MEGRHVYGQRPLPSPYVLPAVANPPQLPPVANPSQMPPTLTQHNGLHQQHQPSQLTRNYHATQQQQYTRYPYDYYEPAAMAACQNNIPSSSNKRFDIGGQGVVDEDDNFSVEDEEEDDNELDADEEDVDDDEIFGQNSRGGLLQREGVIDSDDELVDRGVVDPVVVRKDSSHHSNMSSSYFVGGKSALPPIDIAAAQAAAAAEERLKLHTDRYGFLPGSKEYTDPEAEERIPIRKLKARELKWLDMLTNWDKWMQKRYKKVRDRCRKGIPSSLRARAWQLLSGSRVRLHEQRGLYERLLLNACDAAMEDQIVKDLHRQFPTHELFRTESGHGQSDLYRVLRAYSIYNQEEGYCQAHAPLAALLLMHMPEEDAFWTLHCLCRTHLQGYYSEGLEKVQVDGMVLYGLLKRYYPHIFKHLRNHKVEPIYFMVDWFMCVFSRNLPWPTVLRVWDMFFCEGVKVLFRIAIVLIRATLGRNDQQHQLNNMTDICQALRNLSPQATVPSFLVEESLKLPLTPRVMEDEHKKQLLRFREDKARQAQAKNGAIPVEQATKSKATKSSTSNRNR